LTEKPCKLRKTTRRALKLVNDGIEPVKALQIVNNKDDLDPTTIRRFKNNVLKYSLKTPGTVKKAKSQLDRILSAQPRELKQQKLGKDGQVIEYIETIAPPDSVIMSAVQAVYDRYEPAVQQQLNVNVTVDPIDLGEYLNR
jgi:hypothetical protein